MDHKRLPKTAPQTHRHADQPDSQRLPLPANQESLIELQAMIGNQAVQRLMRQEEEYAGTGSDPIVMDEMEVSAGGGAGGPIVMDEMEVSAGGTGGPVVMDEMEISAGGGAGGQVSEGAGGPVVMDEMEVSAGGGAAGGSSDHIVLPEDKITPGGSTSGSSDHIVLPEDKITPGAPDENADASGGWLESMWNMFD